MIPFQFTEMPPRPEKTHLTQKPSGSYEDNLGGVKTYLHHNRKTHNEQNLESHMGGKMRIN